MERNLSLDIGSDDINLQVHAMFVCPRKWRMKGKRINSAIVKRAIQDNEDSPEDIDDFYIFW